MSYGLRAVGTASEVMNSLTKQKDKVINSLPDAEKEMVVRSIAVVEALMLATYELPAEGFETKYDASASGYVSGKSYGNCDVKVTTITQAK